MSHEDQPTHLLTSLLTLTSRLFYNPPQIIILDILQQKLLLTESELISALKTTHKEFNKIIAKLKEDKIIKCENKIENVEGRQTVKTIYYLDYCMIKDIIKYRIYKMSSTQLSTDTEIKYTCKNCSKEFTLIQAQSLMHNFRFVCDECNCYLVEKKVMVNDIGVFKKMMVGVEPVIEILKRLDEYEIENTDYFLAVKMREEKESVVVEERKVEIFREDAPVGEFEVVEGKKDGVKIVDMVRVNGVEKKFCEVNEEDKGRMSEEEYENYYEIYMKYNPDPE